MKKISLKKALQIGSYEFLKFIYFFGFYFNFSEFLKAKKSQKGVY